MNTLKTLALTASLIAFGASAADGNVNDMKQKLTSYAENSIELDLEQVEMAIEESLQVQPVKIILVETFDAFEQENALEIAADNLEQIQY